MTPIQPGDGGRRERFTRLAALVHEPLQRYALRRVDPADVDDVIAETLLVLWRRLDDVPAGAELPWCYNVARNCLANLQRSAHRRQRLTLRLASEPTLSADLDETDSPELDAALAGLSAKDRDVVLLWAWEGLAPREIAVALGMSANAVSLRLHRAKRRLKAQLAGDCGAVDRTRHHVGDRSGKDSPATGQKKGVSEEEAR